MAVRVRQGGPGWVTQLVRASSGYTEVTGSVPGQGAYESQPMNAHMGGTTNRCVSFPFSLFLSL